ncbi:unnamed protein product [Cuscuta campestris]|uniref:Uncharacterized protein n=1 Tax=Cuscuta campestris TaxID=132261 RepID=A0A484M7S2_9ASTE|nr:unnamed protein product [Cuscuta campestris]
MIIGLQPEILKKTPHSYTRCRNWESGATGNSPFDARRNKLSPASGRAKFARQSSILCSITAVLAVTTLPILEAVNICEIHVLQC